MKLLEEYQLLIERDSSQISSLWKYAQMFLYLLCTISGYVSSVLFYTLREQIFGGNCPLWATAVLISKEELGSNDIFDEYNINSKWWKYIVIDYKYQYRCEIYLVTCFSSCIFGAAWFMLFLMCGKGGYRMSIYEDAWRIIFPAMCFNFIFAIISMYTHYNLEQGYKALDKSIINISSEIYNTYKVVVDISECEILKIYMKIHNFYTHHFIMCNIISYLQIFSAIMVCSWIGALVVLMLRTLVVNDFTILKVRIYEIKEE